jgi:uncharacterized protein (DUF1778 family)
VIAISVSAILFFIVLFVAFRDFSSLTTYFQPPIIGVDYTQIWRMSRTTYKKLRMAKSKKNNNKAKLNLTVREEQRNKLEQMASLENRSVSNLIEVMANERWKRLAEQQGIAYAKTVAEAMNLKLDMDNPADREKLRRAVLDLVAGRKMRK